SWTAPTALLNQSGDRPVYRPEAARFFPEPARLPEDVLVTGGIAGDGRLDELTGHGAAVGAEAARRAARPPGARRRAAPARAAPPDDPPAGREPARAPVPIPGLPVYPHPELFLGRTHGFVDFSEDVSSKDLAAAVAEGYDSAELAKRFTMATMGPVQGKLETVNATAAVASATGSSIPATATPTYAPPSLPHARCPPRVAGQPRRRGGAAFGPGRLLADAALARGARRRAADRGGVDPPGRLRRPAGRGAQRARERRHHRRHPDRQARPARPRHSAAAQPAVRQQVVQARDRPGPLRGHVRRGRRGPG